MPDYLTWIRLYSSVDQQGSYKNNTVRFMALFSRQSGRSFSSYFKKGKVSIDNLHLDQFYKFLPESQRYTQLYGLRSIMVCLDIPLPRCVQNLVKEPPVCLPSVKDIQAVDLIRQFGKEFRKPENEIEKACSLASGPSDLVVLLERPHARQTYEQSFGVFVKDCPTLEAVDELLRYGSDGARSIHTVTILDAFSFEPRKLPPGSSPPKDFIPEERCHQLIEDILKLKGPKVVLCCWGKQNPCENELVCQFRSDGVGKWPFRHEIKIGESHTIAIRSFHPSCAVNYNKSENACLRTLLVCHFTLAFAELSGSSTVPEWMEVVCKDSKKAQK